MNEKKKPAGRVWEDGDGDEFHALAVRKVPPTRSAAIVVTSGLGVYLTAAQCREVAAHLTALADYHEETMPRTVPALPTDPTALAREVLEREERLSAYTYSIPLAAQASWDATRSEQVRSAPALAHAVIELTAKVKRVEDLVDRLEHEAAYEASRGDTWDATCIRAEARRIRKALNGDDQ